MWFSSHFCLYFLFQRILICSKFSFSNPWRRTLKKIRIILTLFLSFSIGLLQLCGNCLEILVPYSVNTLKEITFTRVVYNIVLQRFFAPIFYNDLLQWFLFNHCKQLLKNHCKQIIKHNRHKQNNIHITTSLKSVHHRCYI